jgi:hypothetical protein
MILVSYVDAASNNLHDCVVVLAPDHKERRTYRHLPLTVAKRFRVGKKVQDTLKLCFLAVDPKTDNPRPHLRKRNSAR